MADEIGRKAPEGAHGRPGKQEEVGHVPVLLQEAIDFLAVPAGGTCIDATLGLGGHSFAIAKLLGPRGRLIGFDKDPLALERAGERLAKAPAGLEGQWPAIETVHASFAEIAGHVEANSADGILADLGVSSLQLGDPARGFSFQAEGPLDMRMNPQGDRTADQVVNRMREEDVANV
ncbi:MAG TPA: 16S rRNA (cytosine(1402)-N(4))-methyltransferase, partial [Terriglobales bacterium]|nr:16S rRNA (cytosine(1402)-N(4))-methyltransferase [Terriglobales bacterium]